MIFWMLWIAPVKMTGPESIGAKFTRREE